jgi:hypothetical protein
VPKSHRNYRYFHDRCKEVAALAGLNAEGWHLHRFRDTAAEPGCNKEREERPVRVGASTEEFF